MGVSDRLQVCGAAVLYFLVSSLFPSVVNCTVALPSVLSRSTKWLVEQYPRAWRDRYGPSESTGIAADDVLFGSQRHIRIDARSPQRRNPARGQRDCHEHRRHE